MPLSGNHSSEAIVHSNTEAARLSPGNPAPPRPDYAASSFLRAVLLYALTLIICLVLTLQIYRPLFENPRVPLGYSGDVLMNLVTIKSMDAHGWCLENPDIGAPGKYTTYDYSGSDLLHQGVLRLIVGVTHNAIVTQNLYFLLTFPLTVLAALFVLRQLGVSPLPALVAAELYTFLPYHLLRNEGHLYLAAYYTVPFAVLLIAWCLQGHCDFFPAGRFRSFRFRGRRAWFMVLLCLLVASSGIYYALFTAGFLLLAGLLAAVRERQARHLGNALVPLLLIILTIGINLSPCLLYHLRHGENPNAIVRVKGESEIYGLKLIQLLLPVDGHRIASWAASTVEYKNKAPLVNENGTAMLGLVGSLGFLFLLGYLFFARQTGTFLHGLALCNLFALLFATIGGFNSVLSFTVTPMLRGGNRICVFISFFSLLALGLLCEPLKKRWQGHPWGPLAAACLAVGILVVGLLDEIPENCSPALQMVSAEIQRDREFFSKCERQLPPGSMVFQLPYIPFPEAASPGTMPSCYEHFRAYLSAPHLRWSYGAIKGRGADFWQCTVAQYDAQRMIDNLAFKGFAGIYIDRRGYADHGAKLEAEIRAVLQAPPLVSLDGTRVLYRITNVARPSWHGPPGHASHGLPAHALSPAT